MAWPVRRYERSANMLDVLVRVWKNEKLLFWLFACCGQFQFFELFLLATWARRQRRRRRRSAQHSADISNGQHSIFTVFRSRFASQFLMAICWCDDLFRPYGNEERKRAIRVGFGSKLCRRITWKHLDRVDGDRENSKELNFNGTFHPIVCVFGHHCYRCQFTDCFPTRRAHFERFENQIDSPATLKKKWKNQMRRVGKEKKCTQTWVARIAFHPKVFDLLTMVGRIVQWSVFIESFSLRLVTSRVMEFVID